MIDIFLIGFILFLIVTSGMLIGLYKIISKLLYNRKCKNHGMKILRLFIGIAIIIFIVISVKAGRWLYENPRVKDPDYIRSTYSVVIYNSTNNAIESIDIMAGDNKVLIETVYGIQPKEYRKVNISTRESDFINSITPPYNVYVSVSNNIDTELCVGYFGFNAGGIELVNVVFDNSNKTILEKAEHSSKEYINVLRHHRRDQDILSWYK